MQKRTLVRAPAFPTASDRERSRQIATPTTLACVQDPIALGRALAERHVDIAEPDLDHALANYGERPRTDDWSMRAALTRFAQPHPVRSARVLTLLRRLDATLRPIVKPLEKHAVTCDRALTAQGLDGPPISPYADVAVADLARLRADESVDFLGLLAAYEASSDTLDAEARNAVALLGVALLFDDLGDVLADWASKGRENPPLDQVDAACEEILARLDELGVPEETPPPAYGRRSRGV